MAFHWHEAQKQHDLGILPTQGQSPDLPTSRSKMLVSSFWPPTRLCWRQNRPMAKVVHLQSVQKEKCPWLECSWVG